jgi:hypothetical protein
VIGELLVAGISPQNALGIFAKLRHMPEMQSFFSDCPTFSHNIATKVVSLFSKRNLFSASQQRPDFGLKMISVVVGWLTNLFANTIGLPQYLSLVVLLLAYDAKPLLCLSLALLERTLIKCNARSKLHSQRTQRCRRGRPG